MKATKLTLLAASMLLMATATIYAGDCEGESCNRKGGEKGHRKGERGRKMSRKGHGGHKMMLKGLDLTEDQKEQMKSIREKYGDQMKEAHKAFGEAQKALREAASGDDINEATIRELSKNVADNMAEMAIMKAGIHKEIQALLTDEQKLQVEEKRAQMKKRREQRKEKRKERMGKRKGKRDCDENNEE